MRDFRIEDMRRQKRFFMVYENPSGKSYAIRIYAPGVLPRWRVDVYDDTGIKADAVPCATGHYTNAATVERVVNYFLGLIEDGRMG